ncbi:MAG: flippase-like domain-containing protein [Clostridia bacterium]|nr:flippase-like domain-containing protein [Clostridia bacterium]
MRKDNEQVKDNKKEKSPVKWSRQLPNIIFITAVLLVTFGYLFWNISNTGGDVAELAGEGQQIPHIRNWPILIPVVLLVIVSVFCEVLSLYLLLRKNGFGRNLYHCAAFASADQYFSAITPSASGGQPASGFYMVKSGIPLYSASATLLTNVTIYTFALEVLGGLALLIRPGYYESFEPLAKLMVILGIGFHGIFLAICVAFMVSKKLVYLLGDLVIALLCKLHIFKDKEEKRKSFRAATENYKACLAIAKKFPLTILAVLLLNLVQRYLLSLIPWFVFKAYGLDGFTFTDVFSMQLYCMVGSSGLPVPGAIGVSELLTESMYTTLIPGNEMLCAVTMLVSRTIGAYFPIIMCACITLTYHFRHIGRKKSEEPEQETEQEPEPEQETGNGQES